MNCGKESQEGVGQQVLDLVVGGQFIERAHGCGLGREQAPDDYRHEAD